MSQIFAIFATESNLNSIEIQVVSKYKKPRGVSRAIKPIIGSIYGLLPNYSLCILVKKRVIFATDKLNINKIKYRFTDVKNFETKDILAFYNEIEPGIKSSTVNWRIYSLVQLGIVSRIGRGKFVIGESKNFLPEISSKLKTINTKLINKFPYLKICIWDTSVLNQFMQHQPGRFFIIIEVEKEATQSVFYTLKDLNYAVFVEPTNDILTKYLPSDKDVLIVKPLVSEAPTQFVNNIITTTVEKLLVDIFCDKMLFSAQQGFEMRTIFIEALSKYTINENKMLRYSGRRGKKESFIKFLNSVTNLRQQQSLTAKV